jgi:hypothetical protein
MTWPRGPFLTGAGMGGGGDNGAEISGMKNTFQSTGLTNGLFYYKKYSYPG